MLTEGAVIERLRREGSIPLDPWVLHAGFLYDPAGRRLPMVILTPTWRASEERLQRAGLDGRDVNGDAVRFLRALRRTYGPYAPRIFIGGLIGPRGDAYNPGDGLSCEESFLFHRRQAAALAQAGPDFLLASTLPALPEARGLATALFSTGLPYILSFIIDARGRLLDGTRLEAAIREIDLTVQPPPAGYFVNCVHHSAMRTALESLAPVLRRRLLGFQANTSARPPAELDGLPELDAESPETFGAAMAALHAEFGLRVVGGCCGSDHRHIRRLAELLAR